MLKEVPFICSPVTQCQAIDWAKKNYSHLEGLTLADDSIDLEDLEVHTLLGADFFWRIMTAEIQQGKEACCRDQYQICYQHCYITRVNLSCSHVLRVSAAQCEALVIVNYEDSSNQRKLNQMFELDTLGISESNSVYETFLKDVKFENNHNVVSLPWREHAR